MKPELLVAWLETEGWFRIRVDPNRHYVGVSACISQKDLKTLNRIKHEINLGRIDQSKQSLMIERIEEIPKLIKILDKVQEKDWYTQKYKDYQIWKTIWNFCLKRREGNKWKFWTKKDLEFILKERAKMKYQKVNGRKYKDSEITNLWFSYRKIKII